MKEWATTLNESRRDEALATLREETVIVEAAFLETTAEGDFLIYMMKAEDFDKSKQSAATSAHAIDEYHRQFKKDAWDRSVELEMLVDLDRIAELDGHLT